MIAFAKPELGDIGIELELEPLEEDRVLDVAALVDVPGEDAVTEDQLVALAFALHQRIELVELFEESERRAHGLLANRPSVSDLAPCVVLADADRIGRMKG